MCSGLQTRRGEQEKAQKKESEVKEGRMSLFWGLAGDGGGGWRAGYQIQLNFAGTPTHTI